VPRAAEAVNMLDVPLPEKVWALTAAVPSLVADDAMAEKVNAPDAKQAGCTALISVP
jgi:hypothetical protein